MFLFIEQLIREKYFVELFFNTFTKLIWKSEGTKNRLSLFLANGNLIALEQWGKKAPFLSFLPTIRVGRLSEDGDDMICRRSVLDQPHMFWVLNSFTFRLCFWLPLNLFWLGYFKKDRSNYK